MFFFFSNKLSTPDIKMLTHTGKVTPPRSRGKSKSEIGNPETEIRNRELMAAEMKTLWCGDVSRILTAYICVILRY